MAKASDYTRSGQALQAQQASSPGSIIRAHKDFLDGRIKQIEQWVRGGVRPEALIRFALLDMGATTPAAQKLRECSRQSIYLGLLSCAVTGLEPGALKQEAFLVPFAGQAVFMPGWRGLVKQARRSRDVLAISSNVVREHDVFDFDGGTANTLTHKPMLRGDRGDVIGAYAIARMASGQFEIEWMDRGDLDRVRAVAEARGKSSAWKDWPDQMARKAPIRRLCKRLPLGADYYAGVALEQAHDDGRNQLEILDIETDGAASMAMAQMDNAPAPSSPDPAPEAEFAFDPSDVQ